MMELKTLKDIYKEIENFDNISQEKKTERYLTLKMLRREAVKWVKAFRLKAEWNEYENPKNPWRSPKPDQELKEIPEGTNYMSEIEEWIIKFFNLIGEDLK